MFDNQTVRLAKNLNDIVSTNQLQSPDRESFSRPTLWVRRDRDIVAYSDYKILSLMFSVRTLQPELSPHINLSGEHYILPDKATREDEIKATAWKIEKAGGFVHIRPISQHVADFMQDINKLSPVEIHNQLDKDYSLTFEEWVERQDDIKLKKRSAMHLAEVAIANLDGLELDRELGQLGERCGASDWDWSKKCEKLINQHLFGNPKASNVIQLPTARISDLPLDKIKEEYIQRLGKQSKRQMYRFKAELKREYPSNLHHFIDDFLKGVHEEFNSSQDDADVKDGLETALNQPDNELNPFTIFPQQLANGLTLFGQNQVLPQTSLIMSTITTASALHPVGTEVLIGNKNNNFYQNPAVNHAVVGGSGSGKSILFRAIIDRPLKELRRADKARFKTENEEYLKQMAQWEKSEKSSPMPEPPKPVNQMFLTGSTMEGLKNYCNNAPDYSVLNKIDELSGLFNAFGQYKSGRGNDRQEFLSIYDGDGFNEVQVNNSRSVDATNIAYIGGLQPAVLQHHFQLGASDGLLPRFTFSQMPDIIRLLPDENAASVNLKDLLVGIYKKILDAPKEIYHITGEAYQLFQQVDAQWQYAARKLPDGAMREFYNKCRGLLGRIALNLHLIHELSDPFCGTPKIEISVLRVQQAADIVNHLIQQLQSVHRQIDCDTTQQAILAIIELSNRRKSLGDGGWLCANDIRQTQSKKKRMSAAEIRELMDKAKNMGYGEIRGSGNRIEFKSVTAVTGLAQTSGHVTNLAQETLNPYTVGGIEFDVTKTSGHFGSSSGSVTKTEPPINNGLDLTLSQSSGSSGQFSDFSGNVTDIGSINEKTSELSQLAQPQLDVTKDQDFSLKRPEEPEVCDKHPVNPDAASATDVVPKVVTKPDEPEVLVTPIAEALAQPVEEVVVPKVVTEPEVCDSEEIKEGDEVVVVSLRLAEIGITAKVVMVLPTGFKCEYKTGRNTKTLFALASDLRLVHRTAAAEDRIDF